MEIKPGFLLDSDDADLVLTSGESIEVYFILKDDEVLFMAHSSESFPSFGIYCKTFKDFVEDANETLENGWEVDYISDELKSQNIIIEPEPDDSEDEEEEE